MPPDDNANSGNYVYENAPLVEVVAECRWELMPIASVPGASIDPLFNKAKSRFATYVGQMGFSHLETLSPPEIPIEILANKPIIRCRGAAGRWPLLQLGPGILTSNIIPPYGGWTEFREIVQNGFHAIDQVYRIGSDFCVISFMQLRYINAFTKRHGYEDYVRFAADDLGVGLSLRGGLIESLLADGEGHDYVSEVRIPLRAPEGSQLSTNISPGRRDDAPAAIVDIRVSQTKLSGGLQSVEDMMVWMDTARSGIRVAFETMTSNRLKDQMGPVRRVG